MQHKKIEQKVYNTMHMIKTFDTSFEGVKECHFQDSPGEQYIMELYKLADNCYYRLHDAR